MHKNILLSLFSIALLAGCGGSNNASSSDDTHASAALDSNGSTSTEGALIVASIDGTQLAISGNEAAITAAVNVKTQYQPASCVTATVNNNLVTFVLNDCSGPWGLVHVSGTLVATYDIQPSGVSAEVKASGLTVNGATLNLDSKAVYSVNGTVKHLAVDTNGNGTGFFGTQLARHGSFTFTWDSTSLCASLDGNWSTTIGNDTWSTSVSQFKQCKGLCPASGTIAHTGGITGVTITVTFDGTPDAKWASSNGKHGDLFLLCI
jgi:hypothetical protein